MRTNARVLILCLTLMSTAAVAASAAAGAEAGNAALTKLRATLKTLNAAIPLGGTLTVSAKTRTGKGKDAKASTGQIELRVAAGKGLRLSFPERTIQQAEAEKDASAAAPASNKPTPTATLLGDIKPLRVQGMLSSAPMLLRLLDDAQTPTMRVATFGGHPAHELVVTFPPPKTGGASFKDWHASASIWIDPHGIPLAYASSIKTKGCKFFLCITIDQQASARFRVIDGRLVAVRQVQIHSQSGLGQDQSSDTTYTFRPQQVAATGTP